MKWKERKWGFNWSGRKYQGRGKMEGKITLRMFERVGGGWGHGLDGIRSLVQDSAPSKAIVYLTKPPVFSIKILDCW
jgi:hypothetical protein